MAVVLTAALFTGHELRGHGPAMFVRDAQPDVVAGHGLGDLAALVAADALGLDDAVRLAVVREQLIAHTSEHAGGGMLAITGYDASLSAAIVAERSGVHVARYDSPGRCVVAGSHDQLDAARKVAVQLRIDIEAMGAVHCAQMATAADIFCLLLETVAFRRPSTPVYSSVTAEPIDDPRVALTRCLVAPVLWSDTVRALEAVGAARFIEAGTRRLGDLVCETLGGSEAAGSELVHA
jgi:[acyl-carrier-protein] S-malonyltransferase